MRKWSMFVCMFYLVQNLSAQGSLCEMAIPIDCGLRDGNNNTGMFTTDQYCGTSSNLTGPELVFEIIPPATQIYTFSLQVFGSGQDLDMFLLYEDCDASNCVTNSDGTSINSPDIMSSTLTQGQTYYLVLDGDGGSISEFLLDIECTESFNCDFDNLECDSQVSSNNDTSSFGIDSYCNGNSINLSGPEKVFRFVPPLTQTYTFYLDGFSGDLDMFLVEESCDPDDCIAHSDAASNTPFDIITIVLNGGEEYFLIIDGDGGTVSDFDLIIECGGSCEADFAYDDDCGKVTFTNLSDGDNLSYNWLINGVNYSDINPCVEFNSSGVYNVTLIVSSPNCEDSYEQEIVVELCPEELFCDCCPEGAQHNFEDELVGPVSTFFQSPWHVTYGNPTYIAAGCDDPDSPISIQIEGPSIVSPGSAVGYAINGIAGPSVILEKDSTYCISYCYRINDLFDSSHMGAVKMRATNSGLTNGGCLSGCTIIDVSPTIAASDGWQVHQFLWTSDDDYYEYVFSTDATGVLDGIVDMNIDNVCVSAYTKTCKASFTYEEDECGNIELTSTSCGDMITESWSINGVSSAGPFVFFPGPGVFNVSLTITGIDGCTDTVSQIITTSGPDPLMLNCPHSETVLISEVNGECFYPYTVPIITSNNNATITCFYNGNPISGGMVLMLPVGNNSFSCTANGNCGTSTNCSWDIFVECNEEMMCPSDGACDLINSLNLGTGIDASGNLIPSGPGRIDPFWKLLNNAPVPTTCSNPALSTLNGTPYVINFVSPNTTAWVNLPGVGVIAPYDLGNGGGFGCNNLQNNNGQFLPYIFQRSFCVCEEDEFNLNVTYEGDDQLRLELYNLTNNVVVASGSQYTYPSTPVNFSYSGTLTPGSYALRAYLANTGSTVLGFAMNGGINSATGSNSIINFGECCTPLSVHVQKILDNDCSSDISIGDQVGVGWDFSLQNVNTGAILQTETTDLNGELIFNNVLPGNYVLEEVSGSGWTAINPLGGTQVITVTGTNFNSYSFFNCPSPEVDCDSLMVMSRPYDLPCIDSSIIQGFNCTFDFDPVCGCDGQTYSNACHATEGGVTTYLPGECNSNNIPSTDDFCCYTIDMKNNWGNDIVKLEAEILSADWIFNYVLLDGSLKFSNFPVQNNKFCVESISGSGLPTGLTSDALKICLAHTDQSANSPQIVEFRWIQSLNENRDSLIVCRDTLTFECEKPEPDLCFEIIEDFISCSNPNDPSHYEYCFTLTNYSGFDVGKITLEDLPSGFSFLNNCTSSKTIIPMPNPILNGTISQQMCVGIKASNPIVLPQDICLNLGLISSDGKECCHSTEEICKEILPCCDVCEDNNIIAIPLDTLDKCCYSIDIEAPCQRGYFTKIEAEIITPGVCFGSHLMGSSYAGFWNVISSPTSISISPKNGYIDNSYYQDLFNFCLDKIDQPSQNNPEIKFNWYAINPLNGEEFIACMDMLKTQCEVPHDNICAQVKDHDLVCIPDSSKYRYTFTITNLSNPGFTADKLHLTVENDPVNYEAFPTGPIIPLSPPLAYGQTRTISTCIKGQPFSAPYNDFIFSYRLQNMTTGDCCFESVLDTISIPPCEPDLSCCDVTEKDFCDYFDNLISYEEADCKLSWNMETLDSCDIIYFTFEDGSIISGEFDTPICREVDSEVSEQICISIERWDDTQNLFAPCFMKDTCFTVEVTCEPSTGMCMPCPNGLSGNDLIINGDFQGGTIGFSSDYSIGPSSLTAGQFDVRSTFLGNSSWAAMGHTTGSASDQFLVADGPFNGAIWRQTVSVVPGRTYNFCAWFNNLVIPSNVDIGNPVIEVRINGVVLGVPVVLTQLPDVWINFSDSWIGNTNSAVIEIFNVSTLGFNDVAIDDISFVECIDDLTCCQSQDVFCDLVDMGWEVTVVDCEVKVEASQFDSCHWMWNVGPDWGDGSILLPSVSPANGCWSHTYNASGKYNICATIFEADSLNNECWSKVLCQEVEVQCSPCDSDPCINISSDVVQDSININECCFLGSVDNQFCDDYFKGILVDVQWPASISQIQALNGWTINQLNLNLAELYPPSNFVSLGKNDVFKICNANNGSQFTVNINWLVVDSLGNCEQICPQNHNLQCQGNPGGCVEIVQDSIRCEDSTYCFKVINTTFPEITVKSVEFIQLSPNGTSLTPNPYSINPLMTGDTSEWICVDYTPVANDDICFLLVGHEADLPAGEPVTWCCVDSVKYFIEIDSLCSPTCDSISMACENISVDLISDPVNGGLCCFEGTIENDYCADYFKGIKITTTNTSNISQVSALNGWVINQLNNSEAILYPPSTHIDLGEMKIFSVCNNANLNPFDISVSWLVEDSLGSCIEICNEVFDLTCPDINPTGCVTIVQDSITCGSDTYFLRIRNDSDPGFIIQSIDLISITPFGTSLSPDPVSIAPLSNGMISEWIGFTFSGVTDGESLCFYIVAHDEDITQGNLPSQCCVTNDEICVVIPECPPPPAMDCVQIVEDSINCAQNQYCLRIRNNTNPAFEINSINLIDVLPSDAGLDGGPMSIPTLNYADTSSWICLDYFGLADDTLCFNTVVHLQDITNGEEPTWCCSTLTPHCFVIQDCSTCCESIDTFENLVQMGFDTTILNCDLSFTGTQFDSCHWINVNGIDWGDGSFGPDSIANANGIWSHNYASPGLYNVCVSIFESQNQVDICWEDTYCFEVEAICNAPSLCDNKNLIIPNGLTPNNDGLNDRLIIVDEDNCSSITISVFNRWGQRVYSSDDYKNDWTGQSNIDEALPSGTYFIVAGYLENDGPKVKTYIDIRR